MSSQCSVPGCYAPEMSCSNGEAKIEECEYWTPDTTHAVEQAEVASDVVGEFRFPWTGNAMGAVDLNYVAGVGSTRLLSLAGASDAGKTSLLAAFYLLIARGITPHCVAFAGSLTLEGWENIACSLRWSSKNGPSFPAHTSSGAGRRPGLLHLSLQTENNLCELLAADAPGEWFAEWATDRNASQAEGARWLATCSDIIIVVADSVALSGTGRGPARKALVDLLRRVGENLNGRPVSLVWTKCDVQVSPEIVAAIQAAAARSLGSYREFKVSMHPAHTVGDQNQGQGIVELLTWILKGSSERSEPPQHDEHELELLRAFGEF